MLMSEKRNEKMWGRTREGKETSEEGKGWNAVCLVRSSSYSFGPAVSGKLAITLKK